MSAIMTKRGSADNVVTYEFVCDSTEDLQAIDSKYVTMGSVAIIIQGTTGFEVYMANGERKWINLGTVSSNGENNGNSNPEESNIVGQGTADHMIIHDDEGSNNNENNGELGQVILGPTKHTTYGPTDQIFQRNIAINNFKITGQINSSYYELVFNVLPLNYCMSYYSYDDYEYHFEYDETIEDVYMWIYSNSQTDWDFTDVYILSDNSIWLENVDNKSTLSLIKMSQSEAAKMKSHVLLEDNTLENEINAIVANNVVQSYDLSEIEYINENWNGEESGE